MDYQKRFFDFLKGKLSPESSLPDVIEQHLHVSRDGAYRRIGGRTALTLNEAMVLMEQQGLHLCDFEASVPGTVLFNQTSSGIKKDLAQFDDYEAFFSKFAPQEFFIISNYIGRYHLQEFPGLAFFLWFFSAKTMADNDTYNDVLFELDSPLKEEYLLSINLLGEKLQGIPSVEVMSMEAIDRLINQILYFWETHLFKEDAIALELLEKLKNFVSYLEKITVAGKKLHRGEDKNADRPSFKLFITEIPLMDTFMFFKLKHGKAVSHILNGFNVISTSNQTYCRNIENFIETLTAKSECLTTSGEKIRARYFNGMRKKIEAAIHKVENGN